ncbi:MAG: cystathionine beta-lyase [Rhodothermaceae bacterium]|nr:MAG: cystathionine beta-lyase [Rhodothermaceae bacterium]
MPSLDTLLVHAGEPSPRIEGAVALPVFQTAMYTFGGADGLDELRYIRYNNTPNHRVLAEKLAALEGAEAAVVTASGMAAISAALLGVLRPGDHLLVQGALYGGTYGLVWRELTGLGIEVGTLDAARPAMWAAALKPNTRAVYVEAITNPLMEVGALDEVAAFARAHGLVSLIDNTFATPVNFRPVEVGFDLVLHSATKYLNGHSDLVAGVVAGRADLVGKAEAKLRLLGGVLDPHACFLLYRGLKTLALRMQRHNESALRLARFLEDHPRIERVHYPGLPSSPHHERAARLFRGYGGMISFEPAGGLEAAERLLRRLRLPVVAPSLGGVETLITRPAVTSHAGLAPHERQRLGIHDHLVRLSVGIEGTEDLIADFEQALSAIGAETPA